MAKRGGSSPARSAEAPTTRSPQSLKRMPVRRVSRPAPGWNRTRIVGQEAAGPFVERFNGRRSIRVPVPFPHFKWNYDRGNNSYFEGVAAISRSDVWAVGTFGIEHYHGKRWHLWSRNTSFNAIDAASSTDVWAVGGAGVHHYSCS